MGHLVWKTHPEGGFRGLGNSPSIIILFLSFSIRGSGIGTADNVELGFFNLKDKEYKRCTFEGEYELTSLIGNVIFGDLNTSSILTFNSK